MIKSTVRNTQRIYWLFMVLLGKERYVGKCIDVGVDVDADGCKKVTQRQ
jgi:hypothetical protein